MRNKDTLYFTQYLVRVSNKLMSVMQNNRIETIRGKGKLIEFTLSVVISKGVTAVTTLHPATLKLTELTADTELQQVVAETVTQLRLNHCPLSSQYARPGLAVEPTLKRRKQLLI